MPALGSRTNSTPTSAAEIGAGGGAERRCDDRRRTHLEQPRRHDRTGGDEGALRERRQAADADRECEPGRGEGEVQAACEVGEPGVADDEGPARRRRRPLRRRRRADARPGACRAPRHRRP